MNGLFHWSNLKNNYWKLTIVFILSLLLAPTSFADSPIISAKVKNKTDSNEYVEAHAENGFMRIDSFYYNEEVPPLIDAIFDNQEENYLIEVKIGSEMERNIVLEQRTITTVWLHHEGSTMPTGVVKESKWKPMKKLDVDQYQLNKLEILYPKNPLKKIVRDDELEDRWKDIARQCLKDKSADCYSLNYVEHIEIRVMLRGKIKSRELEKIIIEQGYGC